jgi:hypothetical protein
MKISITRALNELKLLDARIRKEISNTLFVDCCQRKKNQVLTAQTTKEEFMENVKSKKQSIDALVARRNRIKSEIFKSNAQTIVAIANKKYTVIEAIDKKNSIAYDILLLKKMSEDFTFVKTNIEENRIALEDTINELYKESIGTEKAVDKNLYDSISKPLMEQNELLMIDPIKIAKEIEKKENEINAFRAEVDFVLSESNSRTEIDI